jgi:hypothetical protein
MLGTPLRDSSSVKTATIKPYTASLTVRRGNEILWSRSMTNMVPSFLSLEPGETLQQAVKKHEKADPAYFQRVTIPPRILRPDISQTVGRSRIDNGQWVDFFTRSAP